MQLTEWLEDLAFFVDNSYYTPEMLAEMTYEYNIAKLLAEQREFCILGKDFFFLDRIDSINGNLLTVWREFRHD